MKRRNPIFANIWWLLAIVIIVGIAANYFFVKKDLSIQPVASHEVSAHDHPENTNVPLLAIQEWQTSQNLTTLYLPIDNLPIVDIQLIFTAGSAYDGATPGVAQLTNQLIGQHTWDLNTDQISEKFDAIGAIFSTQVTRDAASVTLRTLSFNDERTAAMDLFAHIFADIDFTDSGFSLEKEQLLTAIAAQTQSPPSQASKAFYETIYGDHPYASPVSGYADSVSALKLNDITAFYKRYYNLSNAVLVISGNITREEAENISETLGSVLLTGEPAAAIPVVQLPAATIFEHVNFPSTQKHILIGLPALEKGHPDFFAFYLGNEILGGAGLSSQLFEVVREQEGLAYSVKSQITPLKQKGPFVISLQTRNDASDIALALVQSHLNAFIKEGPTEAELKKAKQNISGSFLMAFNSNAAIAQNLAVLAFYQLPLDYFEHYLDKINTVTLDDIKRVFNTHVGSQPLSTVTLGADNSEQNAQ